MEPFVKLQRKAQEFGGVLWHVSSNVFYSLCHVPEGWSGCPFNKDISINHAKKIILCCDTAGIGHLVHEMGHMFATKKPPDESEEWDFWAWENALALELGIFETWFEQGKDYYFNEQDPSCETRYYHAGGAAEAGCYQWHLDDAIKEGVKHKNLSKAGKAVSVRR